MLYIMLHMNACVKCLGVQSTLNNGSNSFLFCSEMRSQGIVLMNHLNMFMI